MEDHREFFVAVKHVNIKTVIIEAIMFIIKEIMLIIKKLVEKTSDRTFFGHSSLDIKGGLEVLTRYVQEIFL